MERRISKVTDYAGFDYVMYVDASGDDGVKFSNPGTSKLYVVACFSCCVDAVEKNCDTLLKIKKMLHCNPNDEIKSSTVCKHADFPKVLELLCGLDGYINSYVVFKEQLSSYREGIQDLIYWPCRENGKNFTGFCHAYSLHTIPDLLPEKRFLSIIDNMKISEMKTTDEMKDNIAYNNNIVTKYVDSRSSGHMLLQIADILAGIIRYAFEEYVILKGYTMTRCGTCNKKIMLCRGKYWTLATPKMRNINALWPHFFHEPQYEYISLASGIHLYPPAYKLFRFLNCIIISQQKKTRPLSSQV